MKVLIILLLLFSCKQTIPNYHYNKDCWICITQTNIYITKDSAQYILSKMKYDTIIYCNHDSVFKYNGLGSTQATMYWKIHKWTRCYLIENN